MVRRLAPVGVFNDLLAGSAGFRRFVFGSQAERLGDLMRVIQHVAFESIDTRLAARLLALGGGEGHLVITHRQLAAEIGTAREVVSRHLKAFEKRGWIVLGRGTVELLRPHALRNVTPSQTPASSAGAAAGRGAEATAAVAGTATPSARTTARTARP